MSYASALLTGTNPLRSDEDIPLENLMSARAPAALAWGQLQGSLAHTPTSVLRLFLYDVLRTSLAEALRKSGFPSTEAGLSFWFCGLDMLPGDTSKSAALPHQVADALLLELSLSGWEPLADAASCVRGAVRYDRGQAGEENLIPSAVLAKAKRIASRSKILIGKRWPLAVLDHLHAAAAASAEFAPGERASVAIATPKGVRTMDQTPPPPPLWALDLFAGAAVSAHISGSVPLPCPGVCRTEALVPELWPNERAVLVADAARSAATNLIRGLDRAYAVDRAISSTLKGLRRTSRAPAAARLLAGFGALRPIQLGSAFMLSKNGVRGIVETLVASKVAEVSKHRGQSVVSYLPDRSRRVVT